MRTQMQISADSAALAAAQATFEHDKTRKEIGEKQFHANFEASNFVSEPTISVSVDENTVTVIASTEVKNSVLSVVGMESITVQVESQAIVGGRPIEVALVLDNTGSMRNHMHDLREAAKELTNGLYKARPNAVSDVVKMAVVPYVGTVNVGNHFAQKYLDTKGKSRFHGVFMEDTRVAVKNTLDCKDNWKYSRMNWFVKNATRVAYVLDQLVGIPAAAAASALPKGHSVEGCDVKTPTEVNHFSLLNAMGKTKWKGCVEARPEPYDVTDELPVSSNPDTLFVPFFWPDETDPFNSDVYTRNSYMNDEPYIDDIGSGDYTGHAESLEHRWRSVLKYAPGKQIDIKESNEFGNVSSGPNKGCPNPIQPLTNNHGQVISEIDKMTYWPSSGTIISEGLMWGWRVLSPGAPFTEGRNYGENDVSKVIVLMTDGSNGLITNMHNGPTVSDYSAYGYVKGGHFPSSVQSVSDARGYLNGRLAKACEEIKKTGVLIYTVAFGVQESNTHALLKSCATSHTHFFVAESASALRKSFGRIGTEISDLRISK